MTTKMDQWMDYGEGVKTLLLPSASPRPIRPVGEETTLAKLKGMASWPKVASFSSGWGRGLRVESHR